MSANKTSVTVARWADLVRGAQTRTPTISIGEIANATGLDRSTAASRLKEVGIVTSGKPGRRGSTEPCEGARWLAGAYKAAIAGQDPPA